MNHIHLEELAMNAWPALQTVLYDGWIMRFAKGYTKRANSVTPLYPGSLPVAEKIDACERLFRQQNLRPTFRLTGATETGELDKALVERGYQRIDTTSVQTAALDTIAAAQSERAYLLPDYSGMESWLQSFHEFSGEYRSDDETHKQMLANIRGETGYMVLMVEGEVVACGLGVVERGYLGIFDVVTAVSHRNKGYGTELMHSLLAWGKDYHADFAYLQVMTNNPPALNLYSKLGFTEQYQYWYRVLN
ncbi:MAG: GNAT family N-acetyltransferase [Aquificales bacterium]|nr:GNAT family N-acetyltransferase [Aquificales bacterium]